MLSTHHVKTMAAAIAFGAAGVVVAACEPEVGTPEWCNMMEEKPAGDWSTNDARDFAEHCIFSIKSE